MTELPAALPATSPLEPLVAPAGEAPEVSLGVGADKESGRVVLQFKITGPKPVNAVVYYTQEEAAGLAMSLVHAAQSLAGVTGSPVVVPGKRGPLIVPGGRRAPSRVRPQQA